MPGQFTESVVEEATLAWFEELGYTRLYGPDISPGGAGRQERATHADVVLLSRLHAALERLNPTMPTDALEEAMRQVTRSASPSLFENNRHFHRMLVEGVDVEYRRADGTLAGGKVKLVDFTPTHVAHNDWLVVNQFTIIEGKANRRPDVVVFLNGLPLAVIELKNPTDENATIRAAFNQFQTYKQDIPSLFPYNEMLVISDGLEARVGTLTSEWERFMPWRTIDGNEIAPKGTAELEVLLKGIFEPRRLLDLLQHFIVFEDDGASITKKLGAYHQFHAVNKAVASTIQSASPQGNKRVGVIWHTQGSGKSLSMVFYAGKLIQQKDMENPTLVILTDRNDLDDQLFGTFSRCQALLRQKPVQAETRADLRTLLQVASGGVVFTTIQKFLPDKGEAFPLLSDRRNIVVIADEAHRSQYDFIDGFARHLHDGLPNASFIGFTGTPIEKTDRSTIAVFGDYLDVYDLQRAVEDGATVRIYYESRLAKLDLDAAERPKIDPAFEEVTEGEEVAAKEKLKSKWGRLEALVGAEKRVKLIAQDIVDHFERRLETLEGKGMIVCMSRRICVDLYQAIIALRPAWHADADDQGLLKVVMTGSAADPLAFQPHIRNKPRREKLAERFKDPASDFKLVIVRDMWLTGFDAPSLHTMYTDKPMRGHGLMQAIARVNRVFKDKPGGLIVDYLGLAEYLKEALADYTETDREQAGVPQEVAVALMQEKYEVVSALFHGFDFHAYFTGTPAERLSVLPAAMEHILTLEDGKKRLIQAVTALSKAFALAVPHERALAIRDEVGFFQAVRAAFVKATSVTGKTQEDLDSAIHQLVSKAIATEGVVDLFAVMGLKTPDISILSNEFLAEVRDLPHRNLALELLEKLLNDEIKTRSRRNVVESRSFRERLERALIAYENRSIETAQIIAQLIDLAKEMRAARQRGEELGLTEEELAFYDALETNDSAVQVLGDDKLRLIARELVKTVRANVTIDWTVRENVRANLRALVKRLLRQYGYPPDKQEKATQTVLEQAELWGKEWAA
jgi:type I restriction enzyme R subunit